MPNMYIAEFQTTGGVSGGAPSGSTGTLPGLPWTAASFTKATNPNFRNLQVLPAQPGVYKPMLQGLTDTVAVACDSGAAAEIQHTTQDGPVALSSTPQTIVGIQHVRG